jgi:hypothetical protein
LAAFFAVGVAADLGATARHGVLGHRVAELRMSIAAVVDQKRDDRT